MRQRTVLFLDDDRYEMLGMVEFLEHASFSVSCYTTPVEALQALREGFRPDVIISDLIMPTIPDSDPRANRYVGVHFCRDVKQVLFLKSPIIILTVVSDPTIQQEALKYAYACLVKPITPRELLRHVEGALQKCSS